MGLGLIWKNLLSRKLRTFMTVGAVALAVFLVCVLQAVIAALGAATSEASNERLWVQSAVSLYVDLPLGYESKIEAVEGVERVCKFQWFGGIYQKEENFFAQFGVDPEELLVSYPEMNIIDGSYESFEAERNSCIVGTLTAEKFDLKVGDTLPIIGRIFSRTDGTPWEFKIAAIFSGDTTAVDEQAVFFHYDYLKESIEAGSVAGLSEPGIGVYMLDIEDGASPERVAERVDDLFLNGPQRVQTTTEAEFTRQFVSMLGSVPVLLRSIGGGVVFAIFFAVLNTMLMAGRERTRDYGVLKALGFSDSWIFRSTVLESVFLCLVGGVLGLFLSVGALAGIAKQFAGIVPGIKADDSVLIAGLGLSVLLGVVSGVLPARRAKSLKPVEALRFIG